MQQTQGRTQRTRVRGLRVSVLLLLVAVVPLMGVIVVTGTAVVEARAVSRRSTETEDLANRAVDVAKLDAAVFDEMVWTAITVVIEEIGVPESVVGDITGQDPSVELDKQIAVVDELVEHLGLSAVGRSLTEARTQSHRLRTVLGSYTEIARTIKARLSELLDGLSTASNGSSNSGPLTRSIDVLRIAVDTRGADAAQFYGYFAVVFDVRDAPSVELSRLISLRSAYKQGMASLGLASRDNEVLHEALRAVRVDTGLIGFHDAIDHLIGRELRRGVQPRGAELSFESLADNIDVSRPCTSRRRSRWSRTCGSSTLPRPASSTRALP